MKRIALLFGAAVVALFAAWWLVRAGPSEPLAPHTRKVVQSETYVPPERTPVVKPTRSSVSATKNDSDARDGSPAQRLAVAVGGDGDEAPPDDEGEPDVLTDIQISVWPASPEGLRGAIREVSPAIKACYDSALAEVPDLSGRLVVSFDVLDVNGVGKVVNTAIVDDTLADGPISTCVAQAMEGLQFDPPEGKLSTTYPFVFRNQ